MHIYTHKLQYWLACEIVSEDRRDMPDWGVDQVHHPKHDHDPYKQQQQGCRKGPWIPEEDKLLAQYVSSNGEGRWSTVANSAGKIF